MKKVTKIVSLLLLVAMLLGITAFAEEDTLNKLTNFGFIANDKKVSSGTLAKKREDDDPYGYVTTLKTSGDKTSTIFENGGTVYARIYYAGDESHYTDPVFKFTSYKRDQELYKKGPKYNSNHFLKTEVSGCNFAGVTRYQCFRWCP